MPKGFNANGKPLGGAKPGAGRKKDYRKENPLKVSKGIRFTCGEYEGISKAREITGEGETEFMREAITSKVAKTLKRAAKSG